MLKDMQLKYSIMGLLAVLCVVSCQKKHAAGDDAVYSPYEETQTDQIHRMTDYDLQDTTRVGSHIYQYTIHREADDSLGIIEDDMGSKYADNFYTLNILRDGSAFFSKRFTKGTFLSQLTTDFRKYGLLDGFRFSHSQDAKLYFSVCVSYPDSDMSSPFFLIIGPDGSFAIERDNTGDMED